MSVYGEISKMDLIHGKISSVNMNITDKVLNAVTSKFNLNAKTYFQPLYTFKDLPPENSSVEVLTYNTGWFDSSVNPNLLSMVMKKV